MHHWQGSHRECIEVLSSNLHELRIFLNRERVLVNRRVLSSYVTWLPRASKLPLSGTASASAMIITMIRGRILNFGSRMVVSGLVAAHRQRPRLGVAATLNYASELQVEGG